MQIHLLIITKSYGHISVSCNLLFCMNSCRVDFFLSQSSRVFGVQNPCRVRIIFSGTIKYVLSLLPPRCCTGLSWYTCGLPVLVCGRRWTQKGTMFWAVPRGSGLYKQGFDSIFCWTSSATSCVWLRIVPRFTVATWALRASERAAAAS